MEFDNMMTPVIYQDIPSSYGMMGMPMMGMYGGMMPGMMYPNFGINGLRPALSEDKFQKFEAKEKEDTQNFKKVALGVGGALLGIFAISKCSKLISKGWTALKNLFTRTTP